MRGKTSHPWSLEGGGENHKIHFLSRHTWLVEFKALSCSIVLRLVTVSGSETPITTSQTPHSSTVVSSLKTITMSNIWYGCSNHFLTDENCKKSKSSLSPPVSLDQILRQFTKNEWSKCLLHSAMEMVNHCHQSPQNKISPFTQLGTLNRLY